MANITHWYEHRVQKKPQNMILKKVLKLINNVVLGKTIENVRKHWDIKLVTTEATDSKDHTTKCFSENLLAI